MSTAEEDVVPSDGLAVESGIVSDGLGDASIYIQPKRMKPYHVHAITIEQSRCLGRFS